ncbi:hypothetical protein [Bosea sp. Tri-44]|nr:hypothetical protein [Bosea sp. Tri-44]
MLIHRDISYALSAGEAAVLIVASHLDAAAHRLQRTTTSSPQTALYTD